MEGLIMELVLDKARHFVEEAVAFYQKDAQSHRSGRILQPSRTLC